MKTQEIPRVFLLAVKKAVFLSVRAMARTVQLLRCDAYCPISAEIRSNLGKSNLQSC